MTEENLPQKETPKSQMNVGGELQKKRRALKLRLPDVAAQIRIRQDILKKLEANDFDLAAEPVYIRGFLRTYANFLGLNGAELVRELVKQEKLPSSAEISLPTPVEEGALPSRPLFWGALMVVVFIGLAWHGVAWFADLKEEEAVVKIEKRPMPVTGEVEKEALPPVLQPAQPPEAVFQTPEGVLHAPEVAKEQEPTPQTPPPPALAPEPRVRLFAKNNVWIKVYAPEEKEPLFAELLKKGRHYWVPPISGLQLDVGLPPALEIFVDGKSLGVSGVIDRHVRALSLEPTYLVTNYFGKKVNLQANILPEEKAKAEQPVLEVPAIEPTVEQNEKEAPELPNAESTEEEVSPVDAAALESVPEILEEDNLQIEENKNAE